MLRMAERLPAECVSTSMALCVWPCNCYEKDSKVEPDLMWNLDLYARLDLADGWAIIGPVNWYAPSSNLKLMFDRLVCMNGGNPREDLIDHKNPEKAMALEACGLTAQNSPELDTLNREQTNRLSGEELLSLIHSRADQGKPIGKLAAAARARGPSF